MPGLVGFGLLKAICTGIVGSKTMWEATTCTKTFGRPVLKNCYYANARMATMLMVAATQCTYKRNWLRFLLVVLLFSVHFPSHHTWDSLRKGMLWIKGTVNGAQVAKKSNKMLPIQIWADVDSATQWGENFMCGEFHGRKFCGKFRDTRVNHKNHEISTPRK